MFHLPSPGRRGRTLVVLLAATLLAACSTVRPLPEREQIANFAVDARFALKTTTPDGKQESLGGRLNWQHRDTQDHLLLSTPLGTGIAALSMTPGRATLTAGERTYESTDGEQLLADITGQRLPVARLADWLLGRPGPQGTLARDAWQRPLRLEEAGWRVDYAYADETPGAPPIRLTAVGEGSELRLRIEHWEQLP